MEGIQAVATRIQERAFALQEERAQVTALENEIAALKKTIKAEDKVYINLRFGLYLLFS